MAGRNYQDPIVGNMASAQTCANQGLLLKADSAGALTKVASVTDVPIGVAAQESQRDAAGDLLAAGRIAYYPSGGVIFCHSVGGEALVAGEKLYTGQTADGDGVVSKDNSNSAVVIGIYVGETLTTATNTAGLLIPVNTNMAGW